jgi:hypothetical protein
MSAVASFVILPVASLEELRSTAVPKKRFFGGHRDDMPHFLSQTGRAVVEFPWSGHVIATVLVYLKGLGIDLMRSSYHELGTFLSKSRGVTAFIISNDQRIQYSDALQRAFSEEELCAYYNQFNEASETGAGRPMLDGIVALRDALSATNADSVVLVTIG